MSTAPEPVFYNSLRKLRPFFALAEQAGVDVSGLLAQQQLSLAQLHDPDLRVPRDQCVAVLRALFAALGDPLAGLHAADHFTLDDLDLLGYLAQQQPNTLLALESVVSYASLVNDASRARVTKQSGAVTLTQWLEGDRPQLPEVSDYMIASSHVGLCLIAGHTISPQSAALRRPHPGAALARAYRAFFGCPVSFGARRAQLVYPEAPLLAARPTSDVRLALLLRRQADARIAAQPLASDLSSQVRELLRQQLDAGDPSPAAIAKNLRLSGRTLRRRLEASGKSFRSLLDEVRREEALRVIESGHLSVSEAARRVGFDDPSAFSRAFRRWTGHPPTSARGRKAP
ncbi:MAG: AraC family transcriptional regulator ligand-binding domain-containing protein [Polyangiales bacterium]